jgi:hypothetical protein
MANIIVNNKYFKEIYAFLFTHNVFFKILVLFIQSMYNDLGQYELKIRNYEFGLCSKCTQANTFDDWCKECNAKNVQQNFDNWTSENKHIDEFIQKSQSNARSKFEFLEWIPYDRLRNIQFLAQGGFSTIFEAIWLDGWVNNWDYKNNNWDRLVVEQNSKNVINPMIKNPLKSNEKYGFPVVLKSLNDSSNINDNFLNEVCDYI